MTERRMIMGKDAKFQDEIRAHQKTLGPLRIISMIVTTVVMSIAFYDRFPWLIKIDDNEKSFSFENRLLFTLQLSFIDLIPLFISIFAVINKRISSIAINPMDSRGHSLVEQRQRILQNTLEQLLIKLIVSLSACTVLRSNELMILPVFTILFLLGRFTFVLGYPNYRSFGITMNIISAVFVAIIVAYRLFVEGILFRHIRSK